MPSRRNTLLLIDSTHWVLEKSHAACDACGFVRGLLSDFARSISGRALSCHGIYHSEHKSAQPRVCSPRGAGPTLEGDLCWVGGWTCQLFVVSCWIRSGGADALLSRLHMPNSHYPNGVDFVLAWSLAWSATSLFASSSSNIACSCSRSAARTESPASTTWEFYTGELRHHQAQFTK